MKWIERVKYSTKQNIHLYFYEYIYWCIPTQFIFQIVLIDINMSESTDEDADTTVVPT